MGWDIYNEHFNYVDPHYLYPPGGTLIMAPFGYLPVDASHYWFIAINAIAIDHRRLSAGATVQLHRYLGRLPCPAGRDVLHRKSVTNTLVFGNINGCVLLLEVLFFRWLLAGKVSDEWWAGVAIGLTLVVKPVLARLLLLPLLNRQWRVLVTAIAVPLVFNAAVLSRCGSVSDPMNFVTKRTVPYIFSHPRLLQQFDPGQRHLLRAAEWLILLAAHRLRGARSRERLAAVQVLPAARPAVLDGDVVRGAVDRVVAGAVAWPGLLLDDVVPVPDDGRAAQLGDPQLGGVAGDRTAS